MKKIALFAVLLFTLTVQAQQKLNWQIADSSYKPLPSSVHVYFTDQRIVDTAPFRAFYLIVPIKEKKLTFTTDTAFNRRLTPSQFYKKNEKPLVVVNGTFFSFETNKNLNLVIKEGKLVAHNMHTIPGRGRDTFTYRHPFSSAIGITKNRKADVAWTITDTSYREVLATQTVLPTLKDSVVFHPPQDYVIQTSIVQGHTGTAIPSFKNWKMQTAIGGGPVLIQNGEINITNNEELKFVGKAINDKHPRTAMGYTRDGRLVILVVEGRNPVASGATLPQLAQIMKDLGCVEALNLDGGGSSCLLVNGQETIKPSDKEGQRPTPAVFIIRRK